MTFESMWCVMHGRWEQSRLIMGWRRPSAKTVSVNVTHTSSSSSSLCDYDTHTDRHTRARLFLHFCVNSLPSKLPTEQASLTNYHTVLIVECFSDVAIFTGRILLRMECCFFTNYTMGFVPDMWYYGFHFHFEKKKKVSHTFSVYR